MRGVLAGALLLALAACGESASQPASQTVEKTPQVCLDALDDADTVIALATEGLGYAADGFHAAAQFDIGAIQQAGDRMNALKPRATDAVDRYRQSREECRDQP